MYSTERALAEHGAKLSEAERAAVEQALGEAREALKGGRRAASGRREQGLTRASPDAGRGDVPRTPVAPAAAARSRGSSEDGDVVDAEFRDVDERKS